MLALAQNDHSGWLAIDRPTSRDIAPGDVLIRVRAVGICGTDVGIFQGDYDATPGIILGHEAAGEVVHTGRNAQRLQLGTRVAIDPTYYCNSCRMCQTGRPNHCVEKKGTETGVSRDGCFTTYYATQERFLYPLAPEVSFSAATLAEPLSCVLTGVNKLTLHPALRAVILGGGPMGALYASVLGLRGLGGTIVELAPSRREILAAMLLPKWRVAADLTEVTDSELDLVVETTGHSAGLALERLACGAQLLLVGLKRSHVTLRTGELADRSISIIGSIDSIGTFAEAVSLITAGHVCATDLITHTVPLNDWRSGLKLLGLSSKDRSFRAPAEAMKVILVP